MDEIIYESDENFMFFDNLLSNNKSSEFEVNFLKTLYLREPCECALLEINLPNDLIISKFQTKKIIHFMCKFTKDIDDLPQSNYFIEKDNPRYFDKETNLNWKERNPEKHEFSIVNIKKSIRFNRKI